MEIRGVNHIPELNENNSLNRKKINTHKMSSTEKVSISISDDARELAQEAEIKAIIDNTPDVRENKIAEVQAKMKTNAYNDPKVLDEVASRLIEILGL